VSASDTDRLRDLIALCLERREQEGDAAIEAVCRDHPRDAAALRERLAILERSGLLVDRDAAPAAAVPERLGDFRLLRRLGEGGMGVVYVAEQLSVRREVALKIVRPEQLWFAGARARFRREVDAIARLQHPGVVPILAVGEEAGVPYFAMERVAGCSLAEAIASLATRDAARLTGRDLADAIAAAARRGDDAPRETGVSFVFEGSYADACFRVVRQLAEALDHVHRCGVLHRDLKPSNVMVTPAGRAMLVDFGLASTFGASRLTRSGAQLGSLPYSAPEQLRNEPEIDARADLYALGVTLYELLTLRAAYSSSSSEGLVRAIEAGAPPPIRTLNRSVTWEAETVCMTAMERDRARRYASAADFARDLENLLQRRPIDARRPGPALRARRWAQRRPALAVGVALGALIAVGGPVAYGLMERASRMRVSAAYGRVDGLRLSGQSTALLASDPTLGLLLAIEGAEREPCRTANDALIAALHACRERATLLGHDGPVLEARFSPDGATLATASTDGTVVLWETATGRSRARMVSHEESVVSVDWSPDGQRLVTASADGTARLWSVDGACERVLRCGAARLVDARFDGAGARVVTAGSDGVARLWRVADGEPLASFDGSDGELLEARFSPDGATVATAGADGTARLFAAGDGRRLARFEGDGAIDHVRFDPRGERLAVCGRSRDARVFDLATGAEALPPLRHADRVASVEWSRDGSELVTASWDHAVGVWDAATGEPRLRLRGPRRILRFARFSPDGRVLLAGGDDHVGYLWNAATGAALGALHGDGAPIVCGDFSPDGSTIATAGGAPRLWAAPEPAELVDWAGHADKVLGIVVSRDGSRFVTASRDGTARVWDVATRALVCTLADHDGWVIAASFSPDGARVVTAGADRTARVWDAASGAPLAVLRGHQGRLLSARFDAGGARVLTTSEDGSARLWEWEAAREVQSFRVGGGRLLRAYLSADGARAAFGSDDGVASVWDVATGARVAVFRDALGAPVAFDSAGRRLLLPTRDDTVSVWDWASDRIEAVLRGHGDTAGAAACSPDGTLVATGSNDATVRLWDAASGRELARFAGHDDIVAFVDFSPDGRTLVSASIDGRVLRRPVDPLAAARSAVARELTADERIAYEIGDVAAWKEALALVQRLDATCALAEERSAAVRAATGASAEVRRAALAIAATRHQTPLQLARAAWATATSARRDADGDLRARRRAEEACRLLPDATTFRRALGVAQLRCGETEAAVATLSRPGLLDGEEGAVAPALAALVLAQQRLGRQDEARAALERLRAADRAGRPTPTAIELEALATAPAEPRPGSPPRH